METIDEILSNTKLAWRNFVLAEPCWEWQRGLSSGGYGSIKFQGKYKRIHRLLYETFVEPVPKNLDCDHLCRNRKCCNPTHIQIVTRRENLLRGATIAAANSSKTHCINGHEYTADNTLRAKDGTRECRECKLLRMRGWWNRVGAAQAKAHPEKGRDRMRRHRERKRQQQQQT